MLAQFVRSFDTGGNGQLRPAWIDVDVSITGITASSHQVDSGSPTLVVTSGAGPTLSALMTENITSTGARHSLTLSF